MAPHRARPSARSLALVAAALFTVTGLAACGDDDDDPEAGTTTTSPTGGATDDDDYGRGGDGAAVEGTVVAKDFGFTAPDSVAAGSVVTFDNQDSPTHTLTADDGAFDTGNVSGGSQAELNAPADPGEYGFHCEIHSSMTGTLVVG